MLIMDLKNGENERNFKKDLTIKTILMIDSFIHGL